MCSVTESVVAAGVEAPGVADAGADADRQPFRVEPRVGQARIGPGLVRGDERDRLRAVEPAQLDALEHLARVDRQFGRDPDRELGRPLRGERTHPGAAGEHGVPDRADEPDDRRPASADPKAGAAATCRR